MSTTYAMPVTLTGPLPVPPPHRLLSVAEVIDGNGHWMSGGHVYGYPSDLPSGSDPCSVGTYRDKDEGTLPANPLFASFTLYLPIKCTSMGIGTPEEFSSKALAAFEARESFGVEQELAGGAILVTNPFLADGNVNVLASGAAVGPMQAQALLEEAIGATGQMGVIHATPGTVASFEDLTDVNGVLHTMNGTPVASGGGYQGITPSGEAAATLHQAWAFATGPVQVRRSEMFLVPEDISAALDRSLNVVVYRAERQILATWDGQLQAAVLVDRSL